MGYMYGTSISHAKPRIWHENGRRARPKAKAACQPTDTVTHTAHNDQSIESKFLATPRCTWHSMARRAFELLAAVPNLTFAATPLQSAPKSCKKLVLEASLHPEPSIL